MTRGDAVGAHHRLAGRRSTRAFRPERVPDDILDTLLEVAQRAPSWCNTQPWGLRLLDPAQTRSLGEVLTRAATTRADQDWDIAPPARYVGEHRTRRYEAGILLYEALGIERDDREARRAQFVANYRFFDAPHAAILTVDRELGDYALLDAGIYLGTLMLVADSVGLGTVAQGAVAGYSHIVREHLGIPSEEAIVCAVALGYPDERHPVNAVRTDRADPRR